MAAGILGVIITLPFLFFLPGFQRWLRNTKNREGILLIVAGSVGSVLSDTKALDLLSFKKAFMCRYHTRASARPVR